MEKLIYEVIKEPSNALKIAGRRRKLGDKIPMTEAQAQFPLLEGIVALVPTKTTAPAKKTKEASD